METERIREFFLKQIQYAVSFNESCIPCQLFKCAINSRISAQCFFFMFWHLNPCGGCANFGYLRSSIYEVSFKKVTDYRVRSCEVVSVVLKMLEDV